MKLISSQLAAALAVSVLWIMPATCPAQSLIADHTVVEKYKDIPPNYIAEVKKMWANMPGESHSSAYPKGCDLLETMDSRFQSNSKLYSSAEPYTTNYLRMNGAVWQGSAWGYGAGEADWYTSQAGIDRMKGHLTYCNTHNLAISVMGFGWCWDMTWRNSPGGGLDPVYQVHWAGASVGGPQGDMRWGLDAEDQALTGNSVCLDTYLNATQQMIDHCRANNYPTKVLFTTGAVDSYPGESGYQRHLKNERIRAYVRAHNVLLFDYADILCWSNDGALYTTSWVDYGRRNQVFPEIHPDNMLDLSGSYAEDGDHIGQRGAVRLAKAMWWLLARVAGWDGGTGSTPQPPGAPTGLRVVTSPGL